MSQSLNYKDFRNFLVREPPWRGVVPFDAIVCSLAERVMRLSTTDADRVAKSRSPDFWRKFLDEQSSWGSVGIAPLLSVVQHTDRLVHWACNPANQISPSSEKQLCERLRRRHSILSWLDSLTPRQYECVPALVAHSFRGARFHVTPSGNEFGIDAILLLPIFSAYHFFGRHHRPLRLIVQSKKYSSAVSRDKVQILSSTIQAVQNRNPRVMHCVPNWFWAASGTVSGWIIGHSGFQSGAIDYAKDMGIITSDSLELANILMLSKVFPLNQLDQGLKDRFNAISAHFGVT